MFIYYPPPTWYIIHKGIRHINSTKRAPTKEPSSICACQDKTGIDELGRPPSSYYPIQPPVQPPEQPDDLAT